MRIVGLGGGLHDLAACLVEDGRLVRAIEQERLTRVRHACDHDKLTACFRAGDFKPWLREQVETGSVPEVDYCLDGDPITSVDAIAHGARWGAIVWRTKEWPHFWPPLWTVRHLHKLKSHHLAHAASAFLVSPFEEALTLVIDSFGSEAPRGRFETSSLWLGRDRELTPIRIYHSDRVPTDDTPERWPAARTVCSLGVFYSDVTLFCGFRVLDAGKTMGLAPWGSERFVPELAQFVHFADGGEVHIDPRYLLFLRECERTRATLGRDDRFALEADLAYAAQKLLEEAVLHLVRFGYERTRLRSLCLAGGVALNAVANARILEETPIERIFVQPAANDAGIAIGAAFHTYYARSKGPREFVMQHAYLGRCYSDQEIATALDGFRGRPELERPARLCERTAGLLAEGKIVGWVQGGSEFGPRALGNRSILADPRPKETLDKINAIKKREWFRPFAPAVLAEAQSEYFELEAASPYMVLVSRVRKEKQALLGAVTHVDGTARVQTVERHTNPRFHELISAFARRTGVPVLLNTSFNIQGPIVETPAQAVETFLRSELDALVVGNYLLHQPARDLFASGEKSTAMRSD
jgi:carbamoyltransferase